MTTSRACCAPTYPTIPHMAEVYGPRGYARLAAYGATDVRHAGDAHERSPYVELDRADWAALAQQANDATEQPLTAEEIERLRGLGDQLDLDEVQQVYLPLSRLLSLYVEPRGALHRAQEDFLRRPQPPRTPFVIGLAGSVAVGKSTTARVLQQMLAHWPEHPTVVAGDHGRLPATRTPSCERRGILEPQGLPRVLRPQGPAAFRHRHQVRQGRGGGAGLLAPGLRRGARPEGRRPASRHRDHRGAERAAARAGHARTAAPGWR